MTTRQRILLHVLPAAFVTVLAISWPPDLSLTALKDAASRIAGVGQPFLPDDARDVVVNVLVFAPLGWVVARASRSLRVTVGLAAALSAAIELSQLVQPGRIISAADLLANTLGAFLGGAVALGLIPLLKWVRTRAPHPLSLAVVAPILAALGYAGMEHLYGRFDPWRPDFPLTVNNEATGDRPWCGEVVALSIRAGPRKWSLEDFGLAPQGVVDGCESRIWRKTPQPPRQLSVTIREANTLHLELSLRSLHPGQVGPARIVSLSGSPDARNLTFGQDGGDLILRLRRAGTGANGTRPSYRIPNLLADSAVQHVTLEAGPHRTYLAAGRHVVDHRLWLARDWWILLLPGWEWRPAAWQPLLAFPFWAALMAVPGALGGAAAAGRNVGTGRTVALSLLGGGAAFLTLYLACGLPPVETLPLVGAVLLASSLLARTT